MAQCAEQAVRGRCLCPPHQLVPQHCTVSCEWEPLAPQAPLGLWESQASCCSFYRKSFIEEAVGSSLSLALRNRIGFGGCRLGTWGWWGWHTCSQSEMIGCLGVCRA